jgi:hypothetical protein
MSWSFFLCHQALGDEKAVCRDAQRRVVMKAAPAASLEMPQAKFLLELLVCLRRPKIEPLVGIVPTEN